MPKVLRLAREENAESLLEIYAPAGQRSNGFSGAYANRIRSACLTVSSSPKWNTKRFQNVSRGAGEPLDAQVEETIRRDFSGFRPSQGICVQCADLYEARTFSGAAAARRS